DARPVGRQRAQPFLRGLVGAVLVPHGREDAELGEARFAADEVQDALVFVRLQAVCLDEFGRDGDVVGYQAVLPQPVSPPAQRRISAEMRAPCSPSSKGPKAVT